MRTQHLISLALLLSLSACKPKPAQDRFSLHGTIVSLEPRAHQALIKHDDIPGLMQGMTMPFNIHDEKTFTALKPGDILQATLVKQEYESWLENIKVTGSDPDYADDAKPANSATPHRPTAGEAVPNFTFVNQAGKQIHFAQLQGAPVLLTFIYTRCPLPDFCPRMNANLLSVFQKAAAQNKSSNIQLLSITFVPAHDTPSVLRNYARQWTDDLPPAQRQRWQFVVPPKTELKEVLTFFATQAEPDQAWFSHSLSTVLVGADGKILRWYEGNQWTPDDVLRDLPEPPAPKPM